MLGLGGPCLGQCRYEVTILPQIQGPFGPDGGQPRAVNNAGIVTGHYSQANNDYYDPAIWSGKDGLQFIQPPPGTEGAQAMDISDIAPAQPTPTVVGEMVLTDFSNRAFRWNDGTWVTLPLPKGSLLAGATAVSRDNIVVGYAFDPKLTDTYLAAKWTGSAIQTIPPTYGQISVAEDISPDGRIIVGWMGSSPSLVS